MLNVLTRDNPETKPTLRSLRDLLDRLEAAGKLQRIKREVDRDWEIACVTREVMYSAPEKRSALLFENIAGFSTPVATNTLGASRDLYALALGVPLVNGVLDKSEIHSKWIRALGAPILPVVVKTGPCKENILRGADVDITKFPIPIWTPGLDSAPYLSAGSVIQKDPETGIQNAGVYRGMIMGPRKIGVLVQPAKHSGVILQKYEAASRPMDIAIVIGPPPHLGMASVGRVPYGVDEMSVAGALAGEAMEVVRCETVDLMVPRARGNGDSRELCSPVFGRTEGPFGEFLWLHGPDGAVANHKHYSD